jgi:hypothetical protein
MAQQDLTYLLSEQARLLADIASINTQLVYARTNGNQQIISGLEQRLATDQELLSIIQSQIQTSSDSALPVNSAGQIVTTAQQANDDNANSQNPAQQATVLTPSGRINASDVETGTDAPTVPLTQSQATPPAPIFTQDQINQNLDVAPTASYNVGVGAGNEDSAQPNKNATKIEVDNAFNESKIIPQANVLDQYASYTYNASVYLMKPEALAAMIKSNKKTISGSQLLFQSGGAPVQGRNPYFKNDYYIDKIQLKSSIAGKGSNASHNVNTISMTVVEPNGITLLKNLDLAVQSYLGGGGGNPPKKKNFTAQMYLLVIRFYGYDSAGNLVQGGQNGAVVEKYYPMVINKINFKVANKLVEYEIEASAPKYAMNVGQMRGTIPYNVELAAMSVKDALAGVADVQSSTAGRTATAATGATNATTPAATTRDETASTESSTTALPPEAPPTAGAAPNQKLTIRKGLVEAMNQYQLDLVKRGTYTYPDVYSVEFISSSIAQAQIKKVGGDKKSGGSAEPNTAKDQLDGKTQSYDPNTRIVSATAGSQMVQFIDQILRNCTYIEDQQLVKVLEESGVQVKNGSPAKNLAWYKISLEAIPGKYDPKRNDYAYTLKYIIHPYRINDMVSNYFAQPTFKGVHKEYNYWFTGENTQVLSYEQSYSAMYTSIMSGGPASPYNNQNDNIKFSWQTRSNESSQGAAGRANEPAANAADYLYNPGDLATANLSIIGDPGWLQQGEAFAMPPKTSFSFSAFLADGTINFESQQILFEIFINTPGDYDLTTGLMDPNQRNVLNMSANKPGANRQSYVYKANTIVSDFVKGKFTQQLTGSLLTYFKDQSIKSAADSGRSTKTTSTNSSSTTGGATTSRDNTNTATTPDNEWQAEVARTQETAGQIPPEAPDQTGNEGVDLTDPNPQPAPPPEPPTSDGDISGYGEQNEVQIAGVNIDSQYMAREA